MSAVVISLDEARATRDEQRRQRAERRQRALLRLAKAWMDTVDPVSGCYGIGDDWDAHDLGIAGVELTERGQVYVESFSMAQALAEAYPQCSIEGRPGCWRVYERRR